MTMTNEEILKCAEGNAFIRHCGIHAHEDGNGGFYTEVTVEDNLKNPYGMVHGGLLYTMADTTGGMYARQHSESPVTLDSDFRYFSNVTEGTITGRAEVIRSGRTIFVVRVRITSEEDKLLAEGTFSYFHR